MWLFDFNPNEVEKQLNEYIKNDVHKRAEEEKRNTIVKFAHPDVGVQFGYLDCKEKDEPVIHCLCGCEKTFPYIQSKIIARYPNLNVGTIIANDLKCSDYYFGIDIFKEKEKMKVERKIDIVTNDYMVGDKLTIEFKDGRTFTATVQKVDEKGPLFMFDDLVADKRMNNTNTNRYGFYNSDLYKWLATDFFKLFSDNLKDRIVDLTIPTYGQIFGHDDYYKNTFESDNDEQFSLMKDIRNRIAFLDGKWDWYWLQNATKKNVSSSYFAAVYSSGNANNITALNSCGVRPVFRLK